MPTTTAPRTAVRLLLAASVLLTAVLAVLGGATPAVAHAALTASDPAQGSVVASAPESVTLSFSEQVSMSEDSIKVLDPSGERVDTDELQDLSTPSVVKYGTALRSVVPDGTYTVAWKAVSADSHPVSGAFTFSVGAPSETSVSLPEEEVGGGTVGTFYDTSRYFAYGGFVLLVGGSLFVLAVWRGGAAVNPLRRLVVGGWLTISVATVLTLLLRHPYVTGGSLGDSFDLGGLQAVIETKTGTALVSRLLLLAVAALFVAVLFGAFNRGRPEREQRDLYVAMVLGGGLIALGIAATWALAEHASTGVQTQIAIPMSIVHLVAMAGWLGGVAALLVALRAGARVPREAVQRFSRLAFGCVLVLVGTGVYQSWRQVGSWSALTSTEYGRLLIAKLVLLLVLLGAAWYSRRWVGRLTEVPANSTDDKATSATPASGADASGLSDVTDVTDVTDIPETGETAVPVEPSGREPAADAERRAQLARQAAAVATARRQRDRDADSERTGLRRTVLIEAGVAVVLLAVTTLLTAAEPARTASASGDVPSATVPDKPVELSFPFDTGGPEGSGTARVELDPGRTGSNTLQIHTDVDAEEIRVSFTLPNKEIGPLPVTPEPVGYGGDEKQHWAAAKVQLPMSGEWQLAVTIRTSDIDQVTETKNVKIG